MPIPTPRKEEPQNDYVARCMSFMADEDRDQKQKLAICYDKYRRWKKNRRKRAKAKERAQRKIEESKGLVGELKKLKEYFDNMYHMGSK